MQVISRSQIILGLILLVLVISLSTVLYKHSDKPGNYGHPQTSGCIEKVETLCTTTQNDSSINIPPSCLNADSTPFEQFKTELESEGYRINDSKVRCS